MLREHEENVWQLHYSAPVRLSSRSLCTLSYENTYLLPCQFSGLLVLSACGQINTRETGIGHDPATSLQLTEDRRAFNNILPLEIHSV